MTLQGDLSSYDPGCLLELLWRRQHPHRLASSGFTGDYYLECQRGFEAKDHHLRVLCTAHRVSLVSE